MQYIYQQYLLQPPQMKDIPRTYINAFLRSRSFRFSSFFVIKQCTDLQAFCSLAPLFWFKERTTTTKSKVHSNIFRRFIAHILGVQQGVENLKETKKWRAATIGIPYENFANRRRWRILKYHWNIKALRCVANENQHDYDGLCVGTKENEAECWWGWTKEILYQTDFCGILIMFSKRNHRY